MNSYSLIDVKNKHEEVFEQAMIEPVIVTKQSNPSHVLMSFDIYQNLVEKLTQLEDYDYKRLFHCWGSRLT